MADFFLLIVDLLFSVFFLVVEAAFFFAADFGLALAAPAVDVFFVAGVDLVFAEAGFFFVVAAAADLEDGFSDRSCLPVVVLPADVLPATTVFFVRRFGKRSLQSGANESSSLRTAGENGEPTNSAPS